MAYIHLTMFVCSILLLPMVYTIPLASAHIEDYPPHKIEKKVDIVVEGMVYCQSCDHYGLTAAEPIASAKVSVICKNHRKEVSFYKEYEADDHGYFYAQLDGFKMRHNILDHPLQACHVKPVSSPNANCTLVTNINNGLNGAPLRYVKILRGTYYEAALYAAGPVAFRPNQCPAGTHT